jgi:tripartite-type tricarboxylate transporter receptor subunit TctC
LPNNTRNRRQTPDADWEVAVPEFTKRLIATAFLGATLLSGASAADYPSKPIRFLQGFAPGGNADIISRIIGEQLQPALGQPIIYESRAGAGGNLASEAIATGEPDGYSLVLLTTGHTIGGALYKSLKFDPVKDFSFISTTTEIPFFFVVNAKSRFQTIQELVAAAKVKPDAVTFGTAGVGTGQHLTGELFSSSLGIKMLHVPFRGDSAAVTALLSNDIDFIIAPGTAIFGNIAGGTFRALAVSSKERWPAQPNVPTLAETVTKDVDVPAFSGIATTKGVSKDIVQRLNKEIRRIVALPTVAKKLNDIGNVPKSSTPEEMTTLVSSQIARWNGVIDKAGIPRQ